MASTEMAQVSLPCPALSAPPWGSRCPWACPMGSPRLPLPPHPNQAMSCPSLITHKPGQPCKEIQDSCSLGKSLRVWGDRGGGGLHTSRALAAQGGVGLVFCCPDTRGGAGWREQLRKSPKQVKQGNLLPPPLRRVSFQRKDSADGKLKVCKPLA